ncbi:thimet oligopeptidase-like [Portunus trituberculatus]|uniref:thimet oligopeptidase-like n=1 Tax=Portunus trituberculatus TaxID=210409 RepID=UPI001E1CED3E|nr:thimet oligopeptidase-like [Portunus trituberculatus]
MKLGLMVSATLCRFSTAVLPHSFRSLLFRLPVCPPSRKLLATSTMPAPQGINGVFDFRKITPEDIEKQTDALIAKQRSAYNSVGSLSLTQVTYENVIKQLADLMTERSTQGSPVDFPQHAAVDKAVREASSKAEQKLEEFDVEMSMRKDIFDRVVEFKESVSTDGLTAEQKRLVEKLILHGKRNGLHLSEEIQQEVKKIKKRMSELSIKFQRNLNEDNTKLFFTREELAGMPEDFIDELTQGDENKLEVTMKYPHLFPITKKCHVPNTRRLMVTASQSKCMEENTPILEELISLRQKQAELLGYKNHAHYVLEERMAKNPENVAHFLANLSEKLQPLWEEEKVLMLKFKKEECEKYNYEFNGQLDFWDLRYYMNQVEEKMYAVDQNEVRQYFPLEKVTSGLFNIYQTLLGLQFTHVTDADTWHDDVKLYRVTDRQSGENLGYFFLDLYPRDGKFGHAAIFPLQPSCVNADGSRQVAVCAMMCNFTKPTKDKPALLDHSEVESYFHEFGHVMHHICSRATFAMFAGTHVERDFLEAPSQMLENWVWEKEPLTLMSGHYETSKTLPDEIVDKLAKSRKANAGGFNLRQIILGTFDQTIHTRGDADTKALFTQTYKDIMDIEPIPNTNMPANFGHLAGGYDAQYYGYLWSEVFSMDMYDSCFKKQGILNPDIGAKYRQSILQPGGSKDAHDLLRDFLGRDPTPDAFLRSKGLQP